jgi:hypothetical protein
MIGGLELASRKFGHAGKIVMKARMIGGEI